MEQEKVQKDVKKVKDAEKTPKNKSSNHSWIMPTFRGPDPSTRASYVEEHGNFVGGGMADIEKLIRSRNANIPEINLPENKEKNWQSIEKNRTALGQQHEAGVTLMKDAEKVASQYLCEFGDDKEKMLSERNVDWFREYQKRYLLVQAYTDKTCEYLNRSSLYDKLTLRNKFMLRNPEKFIAEFTAARRNLRGYVKSLRDSMKNSIMDRDMKRAIEASILERDKKAKNESITKNIEIPVDVQEMFNTFKGKIPQESSGDVALDRDMKRAIKASILERDKKAKNESITKNIEIPVDVQEMFNTFKGKISQKVTELENRAKKCGIEAGEIQKLLGQMRSKYQCHLVSPDARNKLSMMVSQWRTEVSSKKNYTNEADDAYDSDESGGLGLMQLRLQGPVGTTKDYLNLFRECEEIDKTALKQAVGKEWQDFEDRREQASTLLGGAKDQDISALTALRLALETINQQFERIRQEIPEGLQGEALEKL